MIAHVAEASEASGRVLLWLDPEHVPMPQTCGAAVRIASAYAAELETVVIDGPSVVDVSNIPAAHVSYLGKSNTVLDFRVAGYDARSCLADRQRRHVEKIAAEAHVGLSHASAGGDAIDRLAEMCLARGPWNIVAVSRPPSDELPGILSAILANVSGATGVVVAGRKAAPLSADVVAVIEDTERMPSMVRAAERLLEPGGKIHLMIAAETTATYAELDSHLRLATAHSTACVLHRGAADYGVTGTLDDAISRLRPGFVIARLGGNLLGEARALTRLLAITPAPFLLVR